MGLWTNPPYYLTAYGLAVKHGFVGSEKKWLQSLKGDPGTGLVIIDSFSTYEELVERYPSGITDMEGFCKVGTETDYLLYYWDATDAMWYGIRIIGPDGADGRSAYEIAVEGGYTGTEAEFNQDLANFETWKDEASAAAEEAQTAAGQAEASRAATEALKGSTESLEESARQAAQAAGQSASTASGQATEAQSAADRATTAAERAEAAIGDASWITFEIEESETGKIGWLYCIEADSFVGPDFSVNDEYGSHQGWLEVSYT